MLSVLLSVTDPAPADNDVVAGPWGFAIFMFLIVAVVLLWLSFRRQVKKADRAAQQGLYDPSEPKKDSLPPTE